MHGSVLFDHWQPWAVEHESSVHGFPSSQLVGVPLQVPPAQVSPVVHALPSEQLPPFAGGCAQPPASHTSCVHGFPSPQSSAGPLTHPLPWHLSPTVQVSPSVQLSVFAAC